MPKQIMISNQQVENCKSKLWKCSCMGTGCGLCIGAAIAQSPCPMVLVGAFLFCIGAIQKPETVEGGFLIETFTEKEWDDCKVKMQQCSCMGAGCALCITAAFFESLAGYLVVGGAGLCCMSFCSAGKKNETHESVAINTRIANNNAYRTFELPTMH